MDIKARFALSFLKTLMNIKARFALGFLNINV